MMKLAVIQFQPAFLDEAETIRRLDPLLDRVEAEGGADLVVLPELAACGYNFKTTDEAMSAASSPDDSRFLAHLSDRCREMDCEIVAGFAERDGDALYNSAALISADGIEGLYRKTHLFVDEWDFFEPGNLGLPVFDRPYGRVGILICFDWAFCEAWRVLALRGAEVICHPSNLVLPGRCQRTTPVWAMTNRVFVALANRIGTERNLTFTGGSLIADPSGEVIVSASPDEPAVLIVEIDPAKARDKTITPRNDAFADRRPELYADVCRGKQE
jgi:predicted amidohydrolase